MVKFLTGQKPDLDEIIEHFGTKGMRWGVRKDHAPGANKKTNREASKDAEEFARAQMFFGKGAGTRRKLIKNTVEAKKRHDPAYAQAFDHHLSNQDMSKHASKAVSERSRIDKIDTTKKVSGAVARRFTGEMGTKAAFTAVAIGGAAFLQTPKGRALMTKGVTSAKVFMNSGKARKTTKLVSDFMKKQGP